MLLLYPSVRMRTWFSIGKRTYGCIDLLVMFHFKIVAWLVESVCTVSLVLPASEDKVMSYL